MSQRAALLIGKLSHAQKEWKECTQVATKLHEYPDGNREDFLSRCKKGEFDGVYALYRSNDSNAITGDFNAELLDALPKSVKFVCHNGAGYNNIDVLACTKRGLSVSSTPIAVNDATADVAIWLMLGAFRNIKQSSNAVNQGMLIYMIKATSANIFTRKMAWQLLTRSRSKEQNTGYPWYGGHRLSGGTPCEGFWHEDTIP